MKRIAMLAGISVLTLGYACGRGEDAQSEGEESVAQGTAAFVGGLKDPPDASSRFTLFESGQVRPLALSADKKTLFAVNTPDNRLEIFKVTSGGLEHVTSVPVGLEPVSVAVRSSTSVWVVNHLSDSVSIVDTSDLDESRVVRTLLVGDEPRDIVFAGPGKSRAFITTAHRGQNNPNDPQLTTPGVGRADVWVFNANQLGASLGGTPLTIVSLFGDTPRALAVSPDGSKVYASVFLSGNRTTTINETYVWFRDNAPVSGLPPPLTNFEGEPQPLVGLIVKHNGSHWVDEIGRFWDDAVRFSLPDKDVFVIDANAAVPAQVAGQAGSYSGVGTVLFNMAVNPVSGKVYVSNTDASNDKRFEGPGIFAGHTVRGHLHESRITVLSPDGGVVPQHLNKHIDYASCCAPPSSDENKKSLAQPQGMAVSADGSTLYVAALGSSKVGIYNTAELEGGTFVPSTANQITVSGGGPTGILLDESRGRAYVLTRFNNSISIINTNTRTESGQVPMYNPEPASAVAGRPFLYDAAKTSSHGDSSCGSCHIFGDLDGIAWDLGNPDASALDIPGPFLADPADFGLEDKQKPLKGPMTTQSLRGMDNHGPMHWRGDRTGGYNEASAQPNEGTFDEREAFRQFNVAFKGLLGRSDMLTEAEIQAFTDFALQITYPPNPIRALDNSLTPDQQAGSDFFFNSQVDMVGSCSSCHTVDPQGNAEYGVERPGFFGTSGFYTFDLGGQPMKVPHLRNVYQKVGMFGQPDHPFFPGDDSFMGDQIRGYGVNHEGGIANVFRFVGGASNGLGFEQSPTTPGGFPVGPAGEPLRRQVEAFVLAFPSNMAPIVGQQITLTSTNAAVVNGRINLLIARANQGECDLVVRGRINDIERGYFYQGGVFLRNRRGTLPFSDAALRQLAMNDVEQALTYTCAPPGSGRRMGIDRDLDGYRDGDEMEHGSDPSDPSSVPCNP